MWGVLLFLLLALIASPAFAQEFPKLTGRVVDNADLLPPQDEAALTQKLEVLEKNSGRQFVVATVPDLQGRTIEDYGYRLGRTWAIGSAKKDDGTILLVAVKERKIRIETGYGARPVLTDAVSSLIIRNFITPAFKDGDFARGIMEGSDQIIDMLQLPEAEGRARAAQIAAEQEADDKAALQIVFWVFVVIILFFVIIGSFVYRMGKKYGRKGSSVWMWGAGSGWTSSGSGWGSSSSWGSGGGWGGGGGGFSGGGGSFGGGGASGGW
nr:TPM domain-containing protein [Allosphingosinicella vermicomposti]